MGVVLPGHYETERCGVEDLAERLRAGLAGVEVWASVRESGPAAWVG